MDTMQKAIGPDYDPESELVEGRFWREIQDQGQPDTIFVTINDHKNEARRLNKSITYQDIQAATTRYFINKLKFAPESFEIINDPGYINSELVIKVRFVNDGVVMARLHGIL